MEKGFKQFLWKTGIFVALFVVIQLITIPFQIIQLPEKYSIIRDTDIGKSLLFTGIIFFLLAREKLKKLDKYKFNKKETVFFGVLSIIIFASYFILKNFLGNNHSIALDNIFIFLPLKYIILLLGAIFLGIAIFNTKLVSLFVKKFKKEMNISILLFFLTLFLIIEFQKLWIYMSYIVAKSTYFLLSLTFNASINLANSSPTLGIENFIITVGKPCSGIDSILMFILLYLFIVGFDWKIINKKKALQVFLPGVISVFFLNIIRIYLLILIGAFISRNFALGAFHTSASMILFLAYFGLFWGLSYKWMKRKNNEKKGIGKNRIKNFYNEIIEDSLYKNSIYLMLSSGVVAVLGFISWLICARLFSAHDIGLATTIISVMGLIGTFSLLGLGTGLVRFLPTSKEKNNKINTCFTLVAIVTIIVSSIFLLGIKKFSPDLFFIKENLLLAFSFIFFMILYSWNSIIDNVFISFRKAIFIFTKSSIFGALRIVLPFAVVGLGAYGIFSSYMIALLAGFITVFIILIKKFGYKPKFVFYDNVIKKIGKYSFVLYVAGFIGGLPLLLLPLMITNIISPTTTAYYFMAMQIANLLFVIPSSTTNSLFAEGSNDESKLREKTLKAIKIIAFILVPAILAIVFLGQYVLLAFGKEYSAQGVNFLRVMALSGIFVSINSVFGSVFKVKNRTKQITIVSIISAITILGLSYLTISKGYGLMGIGFSYMIGQAIVSLTYWGMYLKIKKKEKNSIELSK